MKNPVAYVLLFFGLAACAGPGGVSPSGGLLYRAPDATPVVYVSETTADIDIDAGAMGSFAMQANSEATMTMAFLSTDEGVQVTATFDDLSASLSQPMGGSQTATEADIEGDLVFTIDEKGKGTVVTLPEMKGMAEELASPVSIVHEFFPRLPGGAAAPGDMWTDTVQYEAKTGQGDVSSNTVVTYTLQGDTIVDGTTLLLVTYEGLADVVGTGLQEGMEVVQAVSGDVTGMFLWDPARGLYMGGESEQDLTGTVEVPAAGMPPMPMSVKGSGSVKIQGG